MSHRRVIEGENRLSTEFRRIRKENAGLVLALAKIEELSASKADPNRILTEINEIAHEAIGEGEA